jgi:hypothetical protein
MHYRSHRQESQRAEMKTKLGGLVNKANYMQADMQVNTAFIQTNNGLILDAYAHQNVTDECGNCKH